MYIIDLPSNNLTKIEKNLLQEKEIKTHNS